MPFQRTFFIGKAFRKASSICVNWHSGTQIEDAFLYAFPGAKYGWPKNILQWKGIQESILDVCATVSVHFVIADAIVAMEGNGPLTGHPRPLNRIVLADDPVAADATCARLMGLDPTRITHIRIGAQFLGNVSTERIDQLAEVVCTP